MFLGCAMVGGKYWAMYDLGKSGGPTCYTSDSEGRGALPQHFPSRAAMRRWVNMMCQAARVSKSG